MMMPGGVRCIVVVVIMLAGERLHRFAIRLPAMRQHDVPGGKKPAEKSQHREDSKRKTHGEAYRLECGPLSNPVSSPSETERSRSALAMTETELRLMAAPAMIGLRSRPKNG